MTAAGRTPARPDHDVTYVTDVEGSWERLQSFLEHNPHARLDEQGRLQVSEGATFVFGGDAIDRGPSSRRIVRTLLDAKERQPDRVVLLAGNRDLNKLRLVRELDGHPPRRAPEEIAAAPRAELLKWIFAHTMGAADAFEHRRTELCAEGRDDDDESVAQSYLDDLSPGGELARYLDVCQLTWRSGNTLFVHGGIAEEALTVVPGHATTDLAHLDVDVWMDRLDAFYRQQMDAFRARHIEPDGTPSWESAILYQAPRKGMKLNPGSVVYGRMGDEHNNPALPARHVVDALLRAGVRRVVVGHTPSGDTPSIVRTTDTSAPFEVIIADNSRSRVSTGSRLTVRDAAFTVEARCVLDDGDARDVKLELAADDRTTPVGKRIADGSLVKARLDDGWLVFRYKPAFEVTQRVVGELGALSEALPGVMAGVPPPPR
jgi:hypothetical protein